MDFEVIEFWDFLELRAKDLALDVALEVAFEDDIWNGHVLEARLYLDLLFAEGDGVELVGEGLVEALLRFEDALLVGHRKQEGRGSSLEGFGECRDSEDDVRPFEEEQTDAFGQIRRPEGGVEAVVVVFVLSEDHFDSLHFSRAVLLYWPHHKLFPTLRALNHRPCSEKAASAVNCRLWLLLLLNLSCLVRFLQFLSKINDLLFEICNVALVCFFHMHIGCVEFINTIKLFLRLSIFLL